jgi:hypothetical protein
VPADGPGNEVEGRQRDEQQEKEEVDVGDLGGDILPLDAAAEKIEEDEHQDDDDNDFREVPLHRRDPWYHEARRGSTASHLKSAAIFFKIVVLAGKSSNGRTHDSGSCNQGSNPCFPANPLLPFFPRIHRLAIRPGSLIVFRPKP